jgi:hypothetical protein|tara:strand:- start:702 stop:881 length:180 start_codon:yes stop_codon:yes gene_type:complete
VKVEHVQSKSGMTYRTWLERYKGIDIDTITLEQHIKLSAEYQRWKVGNIEKVAGAWWKK